MHALPGQVVEENKRQACVFKLLSDAKAAPKWWDYAAGFAAECTMAAGKFGDPACIRKLLDLVGLKQSEVDACMGNSSADASHALLEVRSRQLSPTALPRWSLACCTSRWPYRGQSVLWERQRMGGCEARPCAVALRGGSDVLMCARQRP